MLCPSLAQKHQMPAGCLVGRQMGLPINWQTCGSAGWGSPQSAEQPDPLGDSCGGQEAALACPCSWPFSSQSWGHSVWTRQVTGSWSGQCSQSTHELCLPPTLIIEPVRHRHPPGVGGTLLTGAGHDPVLEKHPRSQELPRIASCLLPTPLHIHSRTQILKTQTRG